jgi:hypothetical protein
MKLVFTADEVAAAFQYSLSEFEDRRPALEANGFPKPLAGMDDRWSIIDVVNWVNSSAAPGPSSAFRASAAEIKPVRLC